MIRYLPQGTFRPDDLGRARSMDAQYVKLLR